MCPCMYDFYSSKQGTSSPQRWRVNRHCEKAIKARVVTAEVAKKAQKNLVCKNSTRVTCLWLTRSLEDAWKVFFFFFFVFSQCLLHQMFPFCLFFFCHVKRMWRKLYETKITRQNQEGIIFFIFFFVTNDLLLLTTWRPLGAKVRESLELRKSKCYGNLLQLVLAEFRLIHGAAL